MAVVDLTTLRVSSALHRAHLEALERARAAAGAGELQAALSDRSRAELGEALEDLGHLAGEWEAHADELAGMIGECPGCGGEVRCSECGRPLEVNGRPREGV